MELTIFGEHRAESHKFSGAALESKKTSRLENEPSQDRIIFDLNSGVFGIFDGLGGAGGSPDTAARVGSEAVQATLTDVTPTTSEDAVTAMREAFARAHEEVWFEGRGGYTTATVAWFVRTEDLGTGIVFGNAGDSRSFLFNKTTDELISVTENQGYRNVVNNCLGESRFPSPLDEAFFLPLADPSQWRLMVCSDGITGDFDYELLTEEELAASFALGTAEASARSFFDTSRKDDDKSIVVVDFL